MIELVHAPRTAKSQPTSAAMNLKGPSQSTSEKYASQRISYRIANEPPEILDVYEAVVDFLTGLGDDVQVKELQNYIAFKRIKNFVCLEVYPQRRS
jgi:hypothetical protein